MLGLFKRCLLLVLLLALTISCSQDETLFMVELCTVKEKGDKSLYLLSDDGNVLFPSSSMDVSTYQSGQRFRVTYIKMEGKTSSEGESIVDIKQMLPVLIKDVVSGDLFTGSVNDPLWLIYRPWFGGGFLNFEFSFDSGASTDIQHEVQLIQDSTVQVGASRKIFLTFGHNANGDVSEKSVTALVSFPLTSISDFGQADSLIVGVLEGSKRYLYRISVPNR